MAIKKQIKRDRQRQGRSRRPKGLRKKATRDIKELAQPYGPECIERIAKLMKHKDPWICLAACKEMLDRTYGKPVRAKPIEANEPRITIELVRFSDLGGDRFPSATVAWS